MSRKAFFAAHCTHRFDPLHWRGSLSEKSNIPQRESRIRFRPCIGVRSISVSRGLFGQSGGPLELALRALQSQKDILPRQNATLRQNGKLRQSEKLRQNATLMPPTMRPVMPMPSSTKPRTLWPPACTQTAPACKEKRGE